MIVNSHSLQLSNELHQYKSVKMSEVSLNIALSSLKNQQEDLSKLVFRTKSTIQSINLVIVELSNNLQMSKNFLNEWKAFLNDNAETELLVKRYCSADNSKIESLNSKRQTLIKSIISKCTTLYNLVEKQSNLETLLESTSQMYRKIFCERKYLVNTWKEAVKQMGQREIELGTSKIDLENARHSANLLLIEVLNTNNILKEKICLKVNLQDSLKKLYSETSNLQFKYTEQISRLKTTLSNYDLFRKSTKTLSAQLHFQRNSTKKYLNEEVAKSKLYSSFIANMEKLALRQKSFKSSSNNAVERIKQLDIIVDLEKKEIYTVEENLNKLNKAFFEGCQKLLLFNKKLTTTLLEYQSIEYSYTKMKKQNARGKKELSRQIEISYHLDFGIQQASLRITKMHNSLNSSEDIDLITKIHTLEKEQISLRQFFDTIRINSSRVVNDVKKITLQFNLDLEEINKLSEKLKETKAKVEGSQKMYKMKLIAYQETVITLNLMKIKTKKTEEILIWQQNKCFSFETHKADLEIAVHERIVDIDSQKQLLNLKLKHVDTEKSDLKLEHYNRSNKANQFKLRCQAILDLFGAKNTQFTPVQFKIESAQLKHFLLIEGNKLNERVRKAENDIILTEHILKMMTDYITSYKNSNKNIDNINADNLTDLHNNYCNIKEQIKNIRATTKTILSKLDRLTNDKYEFKKKLDDADKCR